MKTKVLFLFISLLAAIQPLRASHVLLQEPFGVRPVGMGGAYTALSEGPESILYNYAAPSQLDQWFIKVESNQIIELPYYLLTAQNILGISSLKIGYLYSALDNIPEMQLTHDLYPIPTGQYFNYTLHAVMAGWSHSFYGHLFGIGTQIIQQNLYQDTSLGAGIGVSYLKQYHIGSIPFQFGATVKNLAVTPMTWKSGHSDTLPLFINTGIRYQNDLKTFNWAMDLSSVNRELGYHIGAEYWLVGHLKTKTGFAIRCGVNTFNFSTGLGIYLSGLMIDYAYLIQSNALRGNEHRFSIGWSQHDFKEPTKKPLKLTLPTVPSIPKFELPPKQSPIQIIFEGTAIIHTDPPKISIVLNSDPSLLYETNIRDSLFQIFLHPDQIDSIISIDIEMTQTQHLILSGFIPDDYQLILNSEQMYPQTNHQYFYKYRPENPHYIPIKIVIFKRQ